MTDRHDIDPARAALITERIDQTFDFVRDVIENPQILETIPNGSMLMFRDVVHQRKSIRLTAYLPKHPGARWGARVTGAAPNTSVGAPPPSESRASWDHGERWPHVAGYDTSDAALDALEGELRNLVRSGRMARRAVGA